MELWHVSYESVMAIPCSRRYRILTKKSDLEKKRIQAQNSAVAQARSKRRR